MEIEIAIGISAFFLGIYQLVLQRRETRRNGKINSLVHISTLIKDKIEFHSNIIESQKSLNKPWTGHAKVINENLRPLLTKVNQELLQIATEYECNFKHADLKGALKLGEEDQ